MITDEQMKLINDRVVSDFLDLHLKVLSWVLKGMTIDEIQIRFFEGFQRFNYVEVSHFTSLLSFDDEGTLRGAYPFSPVETNHRITVKGMGSGYAMCAVDALGVASLFGARTVIQSKDALTQTPIEITVDPEGFDAEPYSDIFVIAPKGIPKKDDDDVYDSAVDSCPFVGFLTGTETMPEEMRSRVTVIPLDQATDYGRSIFNLTAFAEQLRAAILPLMEIYEAGSLPVELVLSGILKRQTNPRLRAAPEKETRRLALNELKGKGVVHHDVGNEQHTERLTLTDKGLRIVKTFLTEQSK
ncbi:MAG: organomercurial lyase [Candidatus Thorarchaeota archaeon]